MSLVLTALKGIPLVRQGDDLAGLILSALISNGLGLEDNDVLVMGQKIVSKAEGRMVNLASVEAGDRARELAAQADKDPRLVELILAESRDVLRVARGTIVVEHKLGFICANAGIDHSNVAGPGNSSEEYVLLLPCNPDESARKIRAKLQRAAGKKIGVMVIDSHGRAWRLGVVGMCIGLAGVPGLVDERGWPDLYGYTLRITMVAAADELAAAASLIMGQAAEGTPIVHVRGFPYPLREGSLGELLRPKEQDLFR